MMLLLNRFIREPGYSLHEYQPGVGGDTGVRQSPHYARRIMRWLSRLRVNPKWDKGRHVLVPPRFHSDVLYGSTLWDTG